VAFVTAPVIGIADDRRRNVLHKVFEHERAGTDGMVPVLGIAVLFDHFRFSMHSEVPISCRASNINSRLEVFHLKTTVYLSGAVTEINSLKATTSARAGWVWCSRCPGHTSGENENDILGDKFPSVGRRQVLPVHAFATWTTNV